MPIVKSSLFPEERIYGGNGGAGWRSMDRMKDREGLKSTISFGHGQSRGACRSLLLGQSDKAHKQKIDGIGDRTALSTGNFHQIDSGSLILGHRRKPSPSSRSGPYLFSENTS